MNEHCSSVKLEEYDYERLLFLYELKSTFSINYYNSNLSFFDNLNKKNLFHINGEMRFTEFCEIYAPFTKRYSHLYLDNKKKLVEDLYNYYIPLSRKLYMLSNVSEMPQIIGVQGLQSCGKATLCDVLKFILNNYYSVFTKSMSIDDLFITPSEFENLKQQDPRFIHIGLPGTHNVNQGIEIFQKIKSSAYNYNLPQHNSGHNNSSGYAHKPIDLLILKGWFLGAEPVDDSILKCNNDDTYNFRRHVSRLLVPYIDMWRLVDKWIFLRPLKFEYSRKWRIEAEKYHNRGKSEKEVNQLVDYFWEAMPPEVYFHSINFGKNLLLVTELDQERNNYIIINKIKH
jgi:D-glycerate 3-kinase